MVGNVEEFVGIADGDLDETHGCSRTKQPLLDRYCPLAWRERLRVITDAMRGLLHLHTPMGSKRVVLHRDIKPSNILLDEHLTAKLSDFGLGAEILSTAGDKAGGSQITTQHVVGTFGYIDPLYSDTGRYSVITDGYAMGITILVILTGKAVKHAKLAADDALNTPSLAPSVADPKAGAWEPSVPTALVEEVKGLCWAIAKRRTPLPQAFERLERLASRHTPQDGCLLAPEKTAKGGKAAKAEVAAPEAALEAVSEAAQVAVPQRSARERGKQPKVYSEAEKARFIRKARLLAELKALDED